MAKKNPLNKDLKEVIKELPKAPGGNVTQPRPLVPGGIQGGPPLVTSSIPGAIPANPTGEVFTKSDPARDLFKFYKTGVDRPLDMPAEPVDLETIEEKKVKPTGAKGSKKTQERLEIAKGVRGGTIGGMTRPPGSKPSLTIPTVIAKPGGGFISSMGVPMAIEIAMERARRKAELETIQESLRDALIIERGEKTTSYVSDPISPKAGGITRDEQKIIDRAAQAARDALLDRDAAIREAVMLRDVTTGEVNPLAQSVTQSEADRRALEGMKKFEKDIVKVKGGNFGKGTPTGDAKDIAMRKVANAAIVELVDIEAQKQITSATPGTIGKSSSETSLLQLGPASGNLSGKTIMLARNGKLSGKPLRPETISQITQAAQAGAKFIVGDMPGVDSEFIKLLNKLNAPYKIYHTGDKPRIQKLYDEPKLPIVGGKGMAAFGAVGLVLDAALLWRQLIQETEIQRQQIQSETMN